MSDARDRGWGLGWPSTNSASHIVRAKCGKNGVILPVRIEIAILCDRLVRALEASRGRPFVQYGCWGYSNRAIRGTNTASNHSWGLAIDLDAPNNGQGNAGYGTMPHDAGKIAARFGFRWGGSTRVGGAYSGTPDPMHFEFMGTPAQAAVLTSKISINQQEDVMTEAQQKDLQTRIGVVDANNSKRTATLLEAMLKQGAELAALRTAVVNDPSNPITDEQLDRAVAKFADVLDKATPTLKTTEAL